MLYITVPPFHVQTESLVDNTPWYTVRVTREVGDWMRDQPGQDSCWFEHIDQNWYVNRTIFDINEQMLIMLKLRWM
jgi:hypothetical protein